MRKICLGILMHTLVVTAWAADWPMPGGNPQRNGWAGSEQQITKANVSGLRMLYKYQTDNRSLGTDALTPPIVNGNLITYRGFKEMLLFAGSSDKVYSVDADLNKLLWESRLPFTGARSVPKSSDAACTGALTGPIVMAGSSSSSLHFAALAAKAPAVTSAKGQRLPQPSPYLPPLAQSIYPLLPTTLTELNALYAVSSDGFLHVLNSSTGADLIPPLPFLPPQARVTSLNIRSNVVYATTADHCDGYRNALFSLDLLSPAKTVHSFAAPVGTFSGTAVTTIGNDGTIYAQLAWAGNKRGDRYYDTVVALTPRDLKVKDYFIIGKKPLRNGYGAGRGIAPMVFSFAKRDLVLAGGQDGRLYLLDSRSLGGTDHRTPLYASDRIASDAKKCPQNGFRGTFSSWFDVETGMRRVYVPVGGPAASISRTGTRSSRAADGSLLAFQLTGTNERPELQEIWASPDMVSPSSAVIANGMTLVLSTGTPGCRDKKRAADDDTAKGSLGTATLFAFDAVTGKQLYASGRTGIRVADSTDLAFANGRAYFTAQDNAVYCFGIPGQQRQLVTQ